MTLENYTNSRSHGDVSNSNAAVDEPIVLDPDPVSSSVEHAAARQQIKHLLGVSS
jgi:hypothetical protein